MTKIKIRNLFINIEKKNIRNIRLMVSPPGGKVKLIAPYNISKSAIKSYLISKLSWIDKNVKKFLNQKREIAYKFIDGESHYVLGKKYLLKIIKSKNSYIKLKNKQMIMYLKEKDSLKKKVIINKFYRDILYDLAQKIYFKWSKKTKLKINKLQIRNMKTRWGSCSMRNKKITLNLQLGKKPIKYIEYVFVHELSHLLEASHNLRFKRILSTYMPDWQTRRKLLNSSTLFN